VVTVLEVMVLVVMVLEVMVLVVMVRTSCDGARSDSATGEGVSDVGKVSSKSVAGMITGVATEGRGGRGIHKKLVV
jgi:hypothetical protein